MPIFWNETQITLIEEIISSTIEQTLEVFKGYPVIADYFLGVLQRINEAYNKSFLDDSRNPQLRPLFQELAIIKKTHGWLGTTSYSEYLNQFLEGCCFCCRDCSSPYIASLKKFHSHYYFTDEQEEELKQIITDKVQTARNTLHISPVSPEEALKLLQKTVQSAPSARNQQTYIPSFVN